MATFAVGARFIIEAGAGGSDAAAAIVVVVSDVDARSAATRSFVASLAASAAVREIGLNVRADTVATCLSGGTGAELIPTGASTVLANFELITGEAAAAAVRRIVGGGDTLSVATRFARLAVVPAAAAIIHIIRDVDTRRINRWVRALATQITVLTIHPRLDTARCWCSRIVRSR
jgi:hypothetical protein